MKIGFIGFGNMARAIAAGLHRSGALSAADIAACGRDFEKLCSNTQPVGYRSCKSAAEVVAFAEVVILAVKPHQMEAVVAPLREQLTHKIVVSVAAGWTFERLESILVAGTHHLSTMPNTPVAVGEGIVVCETLHSLSDAEWLGVKTLFEHLGEVICLDASLLSVAGTICGCSPAFVAMFIESLADAAVKHGIPRADAYRMASQAVAGTGRLQLLTGTHPGAMKDAVCSPGGTTIVGVAELERKGFRSAVIAAVDAIEAKKR